MSIGALKELAAQLSWQYPEASVALSPWCSAWFLHVVICSRHFVLEFRPGEGYGVSENVDETDGWKGHEDAFQEFTLAKDKLVEKIEKSRPKQV